MMDEVNEAEIVEAVRESIEMERGRTPNVYQISDEESMDLDFGNTETSLRFGDFGRSTEPEVVKTPLGNVQVYVLGDETKSPVIAFTGIGMTYETCYKGFLNFPGNKENFIDRTCVYVVEMVGQSEHSPDLTVEELTMESYITVIERVKEEFNINRFLGMGVGIGGQGLLHYTLAYPDDVVGLILFSTPAHKCGWLEWFSRKPLANSMVAGDISEKASGRLINRYFTPELLESETTIYDFYNERLSRLNAVNVGKLFSAYLKRPSISNRLSEINCPVMIFIGNKSHSYNDYLDLNPLISGSDCIEVRNCGDLITVEKPEVTIEAIDNFLYSVDM